MQDHGTNVQDISIKWGQITLHALNINKAIVKIKT